MVLKNCCDSQKTQGVEAENNLSQKNEIFLELSIKVGMRHENVAGLIHRKTG